MPFPKGRPKPIRTGPPRPRLTRLARDLRWVAEHGDHEEAPTYSTRYWQKLSFTAPGKFLRLYEKYASQTLHPQQRLHWMARAFQTAASLGPDAKSSAYSVPFLQSFLRKDPRGFWEMYAKCTSMVESRSVPYRPPHATKATWWRYVFERGDG
jgi:hypothetical protein